jgi:uncharacterized protein (TIGR02231 family)
VTFFEDRAEVVRIARCHVPAGRSRVHAQGLTLLVDDRSLVCKTQDAAAIVYSRIRRTVEDVAMASREEVEAIENEVLAAREGVAKAERALALAGVGCERSAALVNLWTQSVGSVPSEKAEPELARAYDALDAEYKRQLDAFATAREGKEDDGQRARAAEYRLGEARKLKPRFESFAEIEIDAKEACEIAIELTYRTPCALWRPEHLARLVRNDDGTAGEITITTFATVWQMTGEDWTDITCRFSTARPAREASAPHLREDVLTTRRKSDEERRRIVVEARDQTIDQAGVNRGTREIEEMPGVDDGGEAQWLSGRGPATLLSNGLPVRVEVSSRKVPCTVARVCYPELGAATHLRANGTLPGPGPLLAGPVTIGRESELVGKSKTEFVGAGEPFELGFGVDDGVRVRRKITEKRKTAAISGTQTVDREVAIYVSNLSNSGKSLAVIERVPVSEVEDVSIVVQPQKAMKLDSKDGFATFDVAIPAHATREFVLAYTIEAKSNVVLPPG